MSDEDWFESRARRNWIRFFWVCGVVAILGHIVAGIGAFMAATR